MSEENITTQGSSAMIPASDSQASNETQRAQDSFFNVDASDKAQTADSGKSKGKGRNGKQESDGEGPFKRMTKSGFGRAVPIVLAAVLVAVAFAGAYSMRGGKARDADKSQVAMPDTPEKELNPPVDDAERQRRAEFANSEADAASKSGESYHAPFELNDKKERDTQPDTRNRTSLAGMRDFLAGNQGRPESFDRPSRPREDDQPAQQVVAQHNDSTAIDPNNVLPGLKTGAISPNEAPPIPSAPAQQQQQRQGQGQGKGQAANSAPSIQEQIQAARQAEAADYSAKIDAARAERDAYISAVQQTAQEQLSILLGSRQTGSVFNTMGLATGVQWIAPQPSAEQPETFLSPDANLGDTRYGRDMSRVLVGAGEMLYATLDAEVDTDDGDMVLATVRGGKFDGRRVMGAVENQEDNIRLRFSLMGGGGKGRPAFPIDAIALRTEDAKQGMADVKDRHLLTRLGAVAVSALLQGYGDAWSQTTGTTTVTSGGAVITTQEQEPTHRRVRANIAGRFGSTLANEFQREISRPTTYRVRAGKGFVLLFLSDLTANTVAGGSTLETDGLRQRYADVLDEEVRKTPSQAADRARTARNANKRVN